MKKDIRNMGFTIVELMIALVISSLAMSAMYSVFRSQQQSYTAQDHITKMHQNLLAGQSFLVSELMTAGYNNPANDAGAQITAANGTSISFTADLNEDGDVNDADESLTYSLYTAGDGIQKLGRDDLTGALGNQAVAENIEQIEFYYTLSDGSKELDPTIAQLKDIRSVQISILSRAVELDPNFNAAITYTSGSGANWNTVADNFRRRLSITTVQFRNLGL